MDLKQLVLLHMSIEEIEMVLEEKKKATTSSQPQKTKKEELFRTEARKRFYKNMPIKKW